MEKSKQRIIIDSLVVIVSAIISWDTYLGIGIFTDPELVNKSLILLISLGLFVLSLGFLIIESFKYKNERRLNEDVQEKERTSSATDTPTDTTTDTRE